MKMKRILALLLSITMVFSLLPVTAFAAVPENDRPNNPSTNLVIGILDDAQADGEGEFPNEPAVTGFDYYYLQSNLSLSTSLLRTNFSSSAGNYIDIDAFWNDPRINENAAGNAFGYYDPSGLDISTDPFFRDGLENILDKETIINAWISAERLSNVSAEDYDLLFYVLKYETGWSSGYHLDVKVVKKDNVTLSYDANKPEGVTADVTLPSSRSVAENTSVAVEDMPARSKTLTAGNLTYTFDGWNTAPDGTGDDYTNGSSITVSESTILYAQWRVEGSFTVRYLNYNNEQLHKDENIPYKETIPEYNVVPTRPSTSHLRYEFKEWELISGTYNPAVGITEDLVYKAVYTPVDIAHTATVEVVLDGQFDAESNHILSSGEHVAIETVEPTSDGSVYLRNVNGTGDYITLTKDGNFYKHSDVPDGDYYIYIKSGNTYTQVGTQALTMAGADRTRVLPYYSVEYADGVDGEDITVPETAYYYIGSRVDVSDLVPERAGYIFTGWKDQYNATHTPSTALLVQNLTTIITKPYTLTAQWDEADELKVQVVVDHNGRTSTVDETLTVHLTKLDGENYNEVSGTTKTFASNIWYDGNATTEYETDILYTDLNPADTYSAHASIPGYTVTGIAPSKTGNTYTVTVNLKYDPTGYELPFTVEIAAGTPERFIPEAVDVKVTRWNGSDWEVISQHETQSVEVAIDETKLDGSNKTVHYGEGSVHVWGFEGNDLSKPYLYRIEIVRIDLGDYQLAAAGTDDINYSTTASGFFPAGAYTAVVTVEGNCDKEGGGLLGAHAIEAVGGGIEQHDDIVAVVSAHPYNVVFNTNGGEWSENDDDPKTVNNRFTIPDLSAYIPTKDGFTFDGWYVSGTSFATKVESADPIKEHEAHLTSGNTLSLAAKWKDNITVKGTVVVDLHFPCSDTSRTVTVALQMRKADGTYDVTNFTQRVPLTRVSPSSTYATGTYEFTDVPDVGQYRVNVIVTGGGEVLYQNEPTSLDEDKLYTKAEYAANNYTAVLNGDEVAVVNVYMDAATFELGYVSDTSAIAEGFRPTDIKIDLRHDHRKADGSLDKYEVINDNLTITDSISTIEVPQYHANGYLYDYVISVLNYDIEAMEWDDRHYYHYDTTQGYHDAPFDIHYEGPANYEKDGVVFDGVTYDQDIILKAIFEPKKYDITYDLNGGTWASPSDVCPSEHTWGVDTAINETPVHDGYVFTGWTVDDPTAFDSASKKIPAKVWQDVKFTANWEVDVWKDDNTNGDKYNEGDGVPDIYQALLIYAIEGGTWDGTDADAKWYVITLKKESDGEWTDISPAPVLRDYTPPVQNAEPDDAHTTPAYWSPIPYDNELVKAGVTVYTYTFTNDEALTFTFDANGGSWGEPVGGYTMNADNTTAAISVSFGAAVSKIETEPTRDGYEFVGWYRKNVSGELTAAWWSIPGITYNIYEDDTVYAKWEEIPSGPVAEHKTANLYVTLQDENGAYLGGTETPVEVTDSYKVSSDSDADYVVHTTIANGEDNYIYEGSTNYSDDLIGIVERDGQNIVVILQYTKDNWNAGTDPHDGGDDIPDKYQVTITYETNNEDYGTVNKDIEVFTLEGSATTGNVTAQATATAESGAYFKNWTLEDTAVSSNKALDYVIENAEGGKVYTFIANFARSGGGGGGSVSTGSVQLVKVDANDEDYRIPGVVFELYKKNGNLVGKYTTDSKGEINVSRLTVGEYYWKEVLPAEGYHNDHTHHDFKVSANQTTCVTVKNTHSSVSEDFSNDHFAYIIGYDDGLVHPERQVTRAEVATIFFRLLCDEVRNDNSTRENAFSDVNEGDWFNHAVSTMANFGIVNGYGDGTFKPNAPITRAEFAAIAARFDHDGDATNTVFTDIYENWGQREINIAANNGWVLGYEDGSFKPNAYITRAEAMAMVNRVLQRLPETEGDLLDGMITWPDNKDTGKWYYLTIQEATNSHYYDRKSNGYEKWTSLRDVRDWSELED